MKLKIFISFFVISIILIAFFCFYSYKSYSLLCLLSTEMLEMEKSISLSDERTNGLELSLSDINERMNSMTAELSVLKQNMSDYSRETNERLNTLGYSAVSRNQFEALLGNYYAQIKEAFDSTALKAREVIVREEPDDPLWDFDGTRESALSVLEHNPNDIAALKMLGRIAYEDGDNYSAKQYLGKVIELDSNDIFSYKVLSRVFLYEEKYEESAAYFERLVSLEESTQSLTGLGRCFFFMGDFSCAYDKSIEALSLNTDYLPALELKRDSCIALGKDEESELLLLKLIELDNSVQNYMRLGNFYLEKERMDESLVCFENAIDKNPLTTRSQQEDQMETLCIMMNIADKLQRDSQMERYYYESEQLGGNEEIHMLMLRRFKELGKTGKILNSIEVFERNYPQSIYRDEVKTMKRWAKGV